MDRLVRRQFEAKGITGDSRDYFAACLTIVRTLFHTIGCIRLFCSSVLGLIALRPNMIPLEQQALYYIIPTVQFNIVFYINYILLFNNRKPIFVKP
jgi:hypothetical protein